jgi:hypothetical protein
MRELTPFCITVQNNSNRSGKMPPTDKQSPFLDQVRTSIRLRHYSIRTEEAYVFWIRRFILFHGKRHPAEMAETEVGAFLSYLAVKQNVSASTQNQALNALVFLYKQVLGGGLLVKSVGWCEKRSRRGSPWC